MRVHRYLSAAAVLLLSPAFVVLPGVAGTAGNTPVSVSTTEKNVELLAPHAAAVGDGEVTSRRDLRLAATQAAAMKVAPAAASRQVLEVTAPQDVPSELAVVGVTWKRGTGASVVVQYRTRTETGWGRWQAADADGAKGGDGREAQARAGSDPVVLTGARQVQARVLGPRGGTPVDATLTIVDPGKSGADSSAGASRPGAAAAWAAQPAVYSRAQWGADERIRRAEPSYGWVSAVVVHHTAGSNSYTPAQVPQIVRGIYAFHVKGRGWNDIGYNFLVDKWGRIWEGRAGGVDRAVTAAHTLGFNTPTMGISVMGNYDAARPSSAAVRAIARIVAWKSQIHGFPIMGGVYLYGKRYPRVMGHRDANQTSCPGRYLYSWLPWIRRAAVSYRG